MPLPKVYVDVNQERETVCYCVCAMLQNIHWFTSLAGTGLRFSLPFCLLLPDLLASLSTRCVYTALGIIGGFKTLYGFLRLRIPSGNSQILPDLKGCALIRELHVYGKLKKVTWSKRRACRRRLPFSLLGIALIASLGRFAQPVGHLISQCPSLNYSFVGMWQSIPKG